MRRMHFACIIESVPTLQVRDLPEHLYRRLVEAAQRERRSLAQQTIEVIARGLETTSDQERRHRLLKTILERNDQKGRHLPDPVKLIREDRER